MKGLPRADDASTPFARTGNQFLYSLPEATRAILHPLLEPRDMKKGRMIAEPHVPCAEVFFPLHSVISTVTLTEAGAAVEVGLVGNEGFSPLQTAFGSLAARHSTMVQIPDSALGMDSGAFLALYETDADFRERCVRLAEYSFSASTQFAACNGVHLIEKRYARWILMAADRVDAATFELTQEYSAMMLGVRRATVTTIASRLHRQGLLSYRHGRVVVTDRHGLENAACECYAAVNDDLRRLMGYGFRPAAGADSERA